MVRYYKKAIKTQMWTMPNLTSNSSNGVTITGKATGSGQANIYKLFNNTTDYVQFYDGDYFNFSLNKKIKISRLDFKYYATNTGMKADFYGSNDNQKWTKITSINHNAISGVVNITNPQGYQHYKIINIDGYGNNGYGSYVIADVVRMTITATYEYNVWEECTEAEYNQLADENRKIITDVYKAFRKKIFVNAVTVDNEWIRPNISANGTLGGNNFAVSHSAGDEGASAYKAFDGNASTFLMGFSNPAKDDIIMYNPVPIKVKELEVVNVSSQNSGITSGAVYGSNDGSSWTKLTTFTNTNVTAGSSWTINLNSNNKYYKYYKLQVTGTNIYNSGNNRYYWHIAELKITAYTTQTTFDSVQDRYYCHKRNKISYLGGGKQELQKVTTVTPYTTPKLTANGTLGGNNFAVAGDPAASSLPAWKAFDGITSGSTWCTYQKPLTIYFPTPVNVSHIKSVGTHSGNWQLRTWKLQVSDDNVTYKDVTGTLSTSNGEVNNSLSYSGQYKYLRIMPITVANSTYGWSASEIYLTATHTESKWVKV